MVTELQKVHVRCALVLWVARSMTSYCGVSCYALAVAIDANSGVLVPIRGARSAT
jgi:hypothetical protein